ncbi:MAG: DUF3060 domain-containing protein [Acetobacteraceae bacterium]|nr:DUF3060 domain-containing protein [Acetobacteraceae bacterium]
MSVVVRIAAIGLLVTACAPVGSPVPVEQNGMLVFSQSNATQHIVCHGRPIQLDGDHTDLRLIGPCPFVRLAGNHNDVYVEAAAGATLEITGSHNDLVWRQAEPGPPPELLNHGDSNTFHSDRA